MARPFSVTRLSIRQQRQAYVLLLLGIILLLAAWLLHPDPFKYPLGVLCLGVGIKHLTPSGFIPFMLSLWLPGLGLLVLGVIYFLASLRSKPADPESWPIR